MSRCFAFDVNFIIKSSCGFFALRTSCINCIWDLRNALIQHGGPEWD